MSEPVWEVAKDLDSIAELLTYLDKHEEASKAVETDPQFWPKVLKLYVQDFHLDEILLTRGDLETSEDWKVLVMDMARGNAYMYSWYLDTVLGSSYLCPTFAVNQNAESTGVPVDVIITGTLPRPETHAMCVQVRYPTGLTSEKSALICGKSTKDCVIRAIRWLFVNVTYLDRFTSDEFGMEIDLVSRDNSKRDDMYVQDMLANGKHLDLVTKYNFRGERDSKTHQVTFFLSGVMGFPTY
jgi:hypothetical protein